MRFIKRFFAIFRKIQLHILTIFITILAVACLGIAYFSYERSFEASKSLSDTIIRQTTEMVIQKFKAVTDEASVLVKLAGSVFKDVTDISLANFQLTEFCADLINYDPLIASINIALDDASYRGVHQAAITASQRNLGIDWPPDSVYTSREVLFKNKPPTEIWKFYDRDLKVTGGMPAPNPPPDIRLNPWYLAMKDKPGFQWGTSLIPRGVPRDKQDPVIVVSVPLLTKEKEFRGVIGINTTMMTLSSFVKGQAIGKTGRLFVLDEQGNVVLPLPADMDTVALKLRTEVIAPMYTLFQASKESAQDITVKKVKYLSYFVDFPVSLTTKWVIAIALPFDDFFGIVVRTQHQSIYMAAAILLVAGLLVFFMAKRISKPIVQISEEVDKITHFNFDAPPPMKVEIDEIVLLENAISRMRSAIHVFTKFLPRDIVKTLVGQGQELKLGGERKNLTLMFSDIKDFTTISEENHIYALVTSMEHYFEAIAKVIAETEGTIDKYIGDSVMAFWGAPLPIADPINKACIAALKCHIACNINHHTLGLPAWKTRFGVHTGEVIIGNFGTNDRMNYTAIGDTVNTTSRICAVNKQYNTAVMISDTVFDAVGRNYITRPIDRVTMKGKKSEMTVYELVGTLDGELKASQDLVKLCHGFSEAFDFLLKGKMQQAKELFLEIAAAFPNDYPTQMYLKRLGAGPQSPAAPLPPPAPPPTWPQQPPQWPPQPPPPQPPPPQGGPPGWPPVPPQK